MCCKEFHNFLFEKTKILIWDLLDFVLFLLDLKGFPYFLAVVPLMVLAMMLLILSSARPTPVNMCLELYLLILNLVLSMKFGQGSTNNSSILSSSYLARKMLLITMPGDIIQVTANSYHNVHSINSTHLLGALSRSGERYCGFVP